MSTQQDKFTAIANAIRAKKGTTGTIVANDFASEIASIEIGNSSGSATSQFYLNKCVLTLDDGYQIERIPISAGDVIDLGDGEDVGASTNWSEYYHAKSHPAMTFQSWASSIEITDNQFVVPDDICTDYHVGAIYCTSDGKNHYIEIEEGVGYTHREDESAKVVEGSRSDSTANTKLSAMWLRNGTSFDNYAFAYCYSLTSINIPNGAKYLNGNHFFNCYSLTSINIPEGILIGGIEIFKNCYSLTSVNLPEGTHATNSAFAYCYSLTSINIPKTSSGIGYYAFQSCHSLTSINIHDGITSIGHDAFQSCCSLTSVNIHDGITSMECGFSGCQSLTSVNLPNSMRYIYSNHFVDCYSLTSINIPEGITIISFNAFKDCRSLKSLNIPESVTSIGSSAFQDCDTLVSVNIPDGITIIEYQMFSGCRSLKSLNIPESVTSVGDYGFNYCLTLRSINIPENVISIGSNAFRQCLSLSTVILNRTTPPSLSNAYAFEACPCTFLVPIGTVSTYEAATNWSSFAGRFIENTEENRNKFGIW